MFNLFSLPTKKIVLWRILVSSLVLMIGIDAQAETNINGLSATEIMQRVDERYTGDTSLSRAQLVLIDKRGRERIRDLKMLSIDKSDVEKSLIFFMAPDDVQGTSYMSFEWEDDKKEDDSWLYLPAMQKIQRVAGSEESGYFMGSDFSYADINGLDFEDFSYTLLKESEEVDGHDCWVIESIPKDDSIIKKTGYTRSQSWVRKDIFMSVKAIINVKKGKRVKYFSANDIENIQGVWTAQTLQMVGTHKGKKEHASVFKISDVKYNEDVDESLFDTQVMQRGL